MKEKPWSSPHRPLRAAQLPSSHLRGPLTDRTIERYILAGRYGEELRENLLAQKKKKPKPSRRRALDDALRALGL